jgi:phage-related protein
LKSDKKKHYAELPPVEKFIKGQHPEVIAEYRTIVAELEREGRLSMPKAEKIEGKNLFAIRVIDTANIRVFYIYGRNDCVYGIHAYTKKTQKIPLNEIRYALKIAKALIAGGK